MLLYNLPFFFGCPYYQVFNLKVLQLSESMIAYLMIGYYLIKIFISPYWGTWADRLGPRRAIYLVSPLYVLFFALYVFSGPTRPWVIFIAWAIAGIADAGFNVAFTSALYRSIPETSSRQIHFAVYNLSALLFTALGAAMAARLMEALKGYSLTIGPWTLGQFQLLYGGCALLLIPCILGTHLFPGRREEKRV